MPRGSRPGERRGGRKKGTPNKPCHDIADKLQRLGCDPIEGMARIALGDMPCPSCVGRGLPKDTCEDCGGSGAEAIKADLKGKMFAELAQYIHPKRKAVEVTGPDNGPIQHEHAVDLRSLTDDQLAALEALAEGAARGEVGEDA